ncbi:MAG: aminoglycoside phosphotransferase family protein [Actinomycetota bacterium]
MIEPGRELPPEAIAWVERETGGRVLAVHPVQVSSTSVHFVDVGTSSGTTDSLALRRYTDAGRLGSDPWYVPANEIRAMELLAPTPVPAPVLLAADPDGSECDVPSLLTTRLPGKAPGAIADVDDFTRQLAEHLLAIHRVAPIERPDRLPGYERYTAAAELPFPDYTVHTGAWERVLEIVAGPEPASAQIFIHRDYHQWNTLWDGNGLTAIVDWTTGCWGPPAIDVGRMRQNLAWDYSAEVADAFLLHYEALGGPGTEDRVYWELVDCADSLPFGPPGEDDPVKVRRLDDWVADLVAQYS